MEEKRYPLTFEEYKKRIFELFIERGNKKEDWHYFTDLHDVEPSLENNFKSEKKSYLEIWYAGDCKRYDEDGFNLFTDDNLIYGIKIIEKRILVDNTVFPMSYDEFEKKLVDLFINGQDYKYSFSSANKQERLKFLKEELSYDPDSIKKDYDEACCRYVELMREGSNNPEYAFSDNWIRDNPVRYFEMVM